MTGSALFDFLISVILLIAVVTMVFYAIDFISKDEMFRKVARLAVGVTALVAFLLAVKAVLFGGGGAMVLSPVGVIEFAIGMIVVMVVIFVIYWVIDYFQVPFADPVKYIVGALALIAILVVAEHSLFGGGFGVRQLFPQTNNLTR